MLLWMSLSYRSFVRYRRIIVAVYRYIRWQKFLTAAAAMWALGLPEVLRASLKYKTHSCSTFDRIAYQASSYFKS